MSAPRPPRIPALDLARTAALAGMATFHFAYDLEMFGHLPPGTTFAGTWRGLAVTVAASFLAIAGASLWLAHGHGIRWRAFVRRLAVLAGAAALVSAGTRAMFPESFVFFGILHAIAASSVIGLAFLRLPWGVTLAAALGVLLGAKPLKGALPDWPLLDWTGLTATPAPSVDFEPLFPWLAPFLAGLALARLATRSGLAARLAPPAPGRLTRVLAWPGRHSLAVYLIHQPVLIALVWGATWAAG